MVRSSSLTYPVLSGDDTHVPVSRVRAWRRVAMKGPLTVTPYAQKEEEEEEEEE